MASSSSTIDNGEHNVFLSFRGDTRNNFTSHLCDAFRRANIKVFIDKMLDKGEVLAPSLHRAVERAKISVVVFSSDYASSTFCLDELVKILECKESKAQIVLPIFYKVDPSDLRKLKGTYEEAFAKHEAQFKGKKRCREETSEEEMKMQRWKSALVEAANLTGWHVQVTDTCDEAETIREITQRVLAKLKCEPTCKSKGQKLITTPLVGESRAKPKLEKAWECLMDDKISRVGIHGMGGVGKTTIATHIYNQLRDADSFQHVYWVTVSKESSIYKLQSDISKGINLDLSREEDERKRAAKLWEALNNNKRFVLILDDMWESFELEEVGIPISIVGGKLLLTTRDRRLCKQMKCEGIVEVQPLFEREARDLFIRESGQKIDDNPPQLRNIIRSVIKECGGLPLAIKVIARSTIGFTRNYEWRNILEELRKPSDRKNHDMEERVFKLLKVSYDRLRNDKYRQCLHYCAMHPEDHFIDRDDLIEYCIAGGVIDELDSRQEELDMGNAIIDELMNVSLLEPGDKYTKMHDVVRDMVLTIMREKLLVKAGLELKDFPKFSHWCVNLEGISIMENHKMEGCSFNSAPNCYKLKILFMQINDKLSELPNCFFVHMQNLTILDMSCLGSLKFLPDSISQLETLRMLNLQGCISLKYVPCLAALKDLCHLDLSWTSLQNLPGGMEKLVNMKVLRFVDVETICALIPSEILIELSLLQELDLTRSNVEVDPNALGNLKKLETLRVEFKNFEALNSYLESRHWQRLGRYVISSKDGAYLLGDETEDDYKDDFYKHTKTLFWYKDMDWDFASRNMGNSNFVIPFNVEYCSLMNWDIPFDGVVINGCFGHLKRLTLKKCKLKYLVGVDFAKQLLQTIEYLWVYGCAYIEEIIKTEESFDQNNLKNFPTIKLPNLYDLRLECLPRLRSIHGGNTELPSLRWLTIHKCKNLVRLPFRELPEIEDIEGSNLNSKLWWDSLQWDDHNHKQQVCEKLFPEKFGDYSISETETESGSLDL